MQTRWRTRRTPTFGAPVLAAVLTSVLTAVLAAGALLAGCGGDDGETTGTSTQSPTTPTDSAVPTESASPSESATESTSAVQQITVTIAGGEVTPPPDRIEVDGGEVVRIVVTSDEADEIHVHGYDLSSDVEAGADATIEFTADMTGLFEVESHHLGTVLFHLQIQ